MVQVVLIEKDPDTEAADTLQPGRMERLNAEVGPPQPDCLVTTLATTTVANSTTNWGDNRQ